MKLFIATPAYGGMFCWNYVKSMIQTVGGCYRDSIDFYVYTISSDALISRARNRCATAAMEWGADKLLFIDADIGWTWDDILSLLRSDKLVVGGTYPMKSRPLTLNYNLLAEHSYASQTKSVEEHQRVKTLADPATGELSVAHLPTGFMMIDMRVFEKLKGVVSSYVEYEPHKAPTRQYDFFPVRVHDGTLESEDWSFCTICRDNGIPVYLNVNIICTHMGTSIFNVAAP
jgi:hypothetical protein